MDSQVAYVFGFMCLVGTLGLIQIMWPGPMGEGHAFFYIHTARSQGKSKAEIMRMREGLNYGDAFFKLLASAGIILMMVSAGLVDPLLCGGVWLVIGTLLGLLKYATERPDSKMAQTIEATANSIMALDDNPPPPHAVYDDRRNWIHWAFLLLLAGLPIIISIGMLVYLVTIGLWIVLCPIVSVALFLLLAWQGLSLSDGR